MQRRTFLAGAGTALAAAIGMGSLPALAAEVSLDVLIAVAPGPGIPDGNTFTAPASFQYRADTTP